MEMRGSVPGSVASGDPARIGVLEYQKLRVGGRGARLTKRNNFVVGRIKRILVRNRLQVCWLEKQITIWQEVPGECLATKDVHREQIMGAIRAY